MTKSQGIQYLKRAQDLCRLWNISDIPDIRIDQGNDQGPNGYYDYIAKEVCIKRTSCDKDMARTFYHEMRHHYQYHKYRSVYLWWINHKSEYVRLYQTTACVIEEDARQFAHDVVDLLKRYEDSGAEWLLRSFEQSIQGVR